MKSVLVTVVAVASFAGNALAAVNSMDSLKSSVVPSAVENISIPVPEKAAPVVSAVTANELKGSTFAMIEPDSEVGTVGLVLGTDGSWQLKSNNPQYFKSANGRSFKIQGSNGYQVLSLDNGVGGFVKKLSPQKKAELKSKFGIEADYSLVLCYGDYAEGKFVVLVGRK
jgi:hypothetical protein